MLCLWHVKKTWKNNAVQKIKDLILRIQILKVVEEIMYFNDLIRGEAVMTRAKLKIVGMQVDFLQASDFIYYFKRTWSRKIAMWVTGNRNFLHCKHDTNAAMKLYHVNLKSILRASSQKLNGKSMDWLVVHLIGDVLIHYWYDVQCKLYGFVTNQKLEGIVARGVLKAHEILDNYIFMYYNEKNVTLVISINNYPAVWTVICPNSTWA